MSRDDLDTVLDELGYASRSSLTHSELVYVRAALMARLNRKREVLAVVLENIAAIAGELEDLDHEMEERRY